LVLRQNGIVPLHAVTSTNAIHFLFRTVKEERLRWWLLLQNCAFVSLLRDAAKDRDKLRDIKIETLASNADASRTRNSFPKPGKRSRFGISPSLYLPPAIEFAKRFFCFCAQLRILERQ
jgi:hypothetical protein